MHWLSFWRALFCFAIAPLFFGGSKSSSSQSATTTNQADNRVVLGNNATQVGQSGSIASNANNTTTTTYNAFDPGAIELADHSARLTAGLQQAIAESQGDTVTAIAKFGSNAITTQAQAATDLYATGSAEAGKAWGHTVDVAGELLDRLMTTTAGVSASAQSVAANAIQAYAPSAQPVAQAPGFSVPMIAIACAAGLALLLVVTRT